MNSQPMNMASPEVFTNSLGQSFRVQTVLVPIDTNVPSHTITSYSPFQPQSSAQYLPVNTMLADEPVHYFQNDAPSNGRCCDPRATRVALNIFSFLLYLTMFFMRPWHFLSSFTLIGTLCNVGAIFLSLLGMILSIVSCCLQGLCCRSRDDGGQCCTEQKCPCLTATDCYRERSEAAFWNAHWALFLINATLIAIDAFNVAGFFEYSYYYTYNTVAFVFALTGYFWMEALMVIFFAVIVALNCQCCGMTRIGPFYIGSTELKSC